MSGFFNPGGGLFGGPGFMTLGKGLQFFQPQNTWTPKKLFAAGEAGAWYDPSDLSTLFMDAAGTIPVVADGDPVGMMKDKSGNGNHMLQAVSASRPTYHTDGLHPWLSFDGVDDYMSAGDKLQLRTNSCIFSVGVDITLPGWLFAKAVAAGEPSRYAFGISAPTNGFQTALFSSTIAPSCMSPTVYTETDKDIQTYIIDRRTAASALVLRNSGNVIKTTAFNETPYDMIRTTRALLGAYPSAYDTYEIGHCGMSFYQCVFRMAYDPDITSKIESSINKKTGGGL